MTADEKDARLSNKKIGVIQKVLIHADLMGMLEKQGISEADIESLCAQAKDREDPPDRPATCSRTFSLQCGRLVLTQIRQGYREAAFHYNLDLDLQEDKGWIDCQIFGKVTGTKENIDAFSAWARNWPRQ